MKHGWYWARMAGGYSDWGIYYHFNGVFYRGDTKMGQYYLDIDTLRGPVTAPMWWKWYDRLRCWWKYL